jgi:ribose transport system substrate-binding protein
MKSTAKLMGLGLLGALAIATAKPPVAWAASTASDGIALSNSYAGNSWRQQMLTMWNLAAKEAISNHDIAKTKVVNANNSAPQQASQISDLILEGWKSIVIDAASPTALNGIIQQACSAHIVVVVFDSLATAPCAYKVAYNYVSMGQAEAEYVAKRLNGKGNVLEVRGIAGTSVDNDIHKGVVETLAKYPGMKLVGSVHGNWTQSIAQKEVASLLPSLPEVNAVVTQGGDGYGTYEAFKSAGRSIPLIIFGNRQDELQLWKQLSEQSGGYETFSISSAPGVSSIALWVAQQILAGAKVPKTVNVPLLVINQNDLDAWLKAVPQGGVSTPLYDEIWTESLIKANVDHTALPASPIPNGVP